MSRRYKFGTAAGLVGGAVGRLDLRAPGTFNPSVAGSSPARPTVKQAAKRTFRAAVGAGTNPPNRGGSVQNRHSARRGC